MLLSGSGRKHVESASSGRLLRTISMEWRSARPSGRALIMPISDAAKALPELFKCMNAA